MGRFQGDLPARTYRFALSGVRLAERLPQATVGWVVGKQLIRSCTGTGANVREADVALTNREFAHLCNIARREAIKTHYWISLCRDGDLLDKESADPMIHEADEIMRILSTIVRKSQAHADQGVA